MGKVFLNLKNEYNKWIASFSLSGMIVDGMQRWCCVLGGGKGKWRSGGPRVAVVT